MRIKKTNIFSVFWVMLIMLVVPLITDGTSFAASGAYNATGVLGQSNYTDNSSGDGPSSFNHPSSTVIDSVHHRLFVADYSNDRVLIYNLDNSNNLSSQSANNVLGYTDLNETTQSGNDGSFDNPIALAYDSNYNRLFVQDDNRVLVFDLSSGINNGMDASYEIGEPDFNTFSSGCSNTQANNLCNDGDYAGGLAYDTINNRLFVSDLARVLVFNVAPSNISSGMSATYALGEPDLMTSECSTTQSSMCWDYWGAGLAFDPSNEDLFVADSGNNRVLVFNVAPSNISTGMNARYVLGQSDFTSRDCSTTQSGICSGYYAMGLGYDTTRHILYVSDTENFQGERILVFNLANGISNGMNATAVLGATDFITVGSGTTQSQFSDTDYYFDSQFAVDSLNDRIYFPDSYNNRVMIFNFAHITTNTLPNVTMGASYNQSLASTDMQGTLSYGVSGGSLPPGLSLNSTTGVISGIAKTAGSYTFDISAYDNNGAIGTFVDDPTYNIVVSSSIVPGSVKSPDTGYGQPQSFGSIDLLLLAVSVVFVSVGLVSLYKSYK